jgi:hypothetical protein
MDKTKKIFPPPTAYTEFTVIDWNTHQSIRFQFNQTLSFNEESFNKLLDELREYVVFDFQRKKKNV